eukprot:72654-Amphidinium_carterae.1
MARSPSMSCAQRCEKVGGEVCSSRPRPWGELQTCLASMSSGFQNLIARPMSQQSSRSGRRSRPAMIV